MSPFKCNESKRLKKRGKKKRDYHIVRKGHLKRAKKKKKKKKATMSLYLFVFFFFWSFPP